MDVLWELLSLLWEFLLEPVSLAEFGSFLAAIFALNIAFGVWGVYIQEFVAERRKSTKRAVIRKGGKTDKAVDAAILAEYIKEERANTVAIDKTVDRWRNIAIIVGFLVLALLGLNGFAPLFGHSQGFGVPWSVMLIGSVGALIPVWAYIHVRRVMSRWQEGILVRYEILVSFSEVLADEREQRKGE